VLSVKGAASIGHLMKRYVLLNSNIVKGSGGMWIANDFEFVMTLDLN
jgi:hypothetical protein